ncbi:hypothetical protein NW766_011156 [Fusarium irregulare]|uniref:Uncharacterized protein n=1 Tax=Fusarium irregulare TaxID=2494466 RepID=A0A9W8U5I1_9HYPO|nr:hypothetical protein NW766_011156 [Fusarium irregulare]
MASRHNQWVTEDVDRIVRLERDIEKREAEEKKEKEGKPTFDDMIAAARERILKEEAEKSKK